MTAPAAEMRPAIYPSAKPKRRWPVLLLPVVVVAAAALHLVNRPPVVEVVAPGALIVRMSGDDFANAYYDMLNTLNAQILGEDGRGYKRNGKVALGYTKREFKLPDETSVTVSSTWEFHRSILFIHVQPPSSSTESPGDIERRMTDLLAQHLQRYAERPRFAWVRQFFR